MVALGVLFAVKDQAHGGDLLSRNAADYRGFSSLYRVFVELSRTRVPFLAKKIKKFKNPLDKGESVCYNESSKKKQSVALTVRHRLPVDIRFPASAVLDARVLFLSRSPRFLFFVRRIH